MDFVPRDLLAVFDSSEIVYKGRFLLPHQISDQLLFYLDLTPLLPLGKKKNLSEMYTFVLSSQSLEKIQKWSVENHSLCLTINRLWRAFRMVFSTIDHRAITTFNTSQGVTCPVIWAIYFHCMPFFSPLSRKKERAMHFVTCEFFNTAQSRALTPTEKLDATKAWAKGCE